MLEESLINSLFDNLGSSVGIAGAVCLLVAGITAYVIEGRLRQAIHDWLSASAAVVGAAGASLLAVGADGVVTQNEWIAALCVALFASPASRGFWARVRDLLPERNS